jgi:hypothetical protein
MGAALKAAFSFTAAVEHLPFDDCRISSVKPPLSRPTASFRAAVIRNSSKAVKFPPEWL